MYSVGGKIKFKTTFFRWSLGLYTDSYIFVKEKVAITEQRIDTATLKANRTVKNIAFIYCTPFSQKEIAPYLIKLLLLIL